MTKKSFKKFLLASSCAVTTLCAPAYEAAAGNTPIYFDIYNISTNPPAQSNTLRLSAISLPPSYSIKYNLLNFFPHPATVPLTADINTKIQSLDINNTTGAQLIVTRLNLSCMDLPINARKK